MNYKGVMNNEKNFSGGHSDTYAVGFYSLRKFGGGYTGGKSCLNRHEVCRSR